MKENLYQEAEHLFNAFIEKSLDYFIKKNKNRGLLIDLIQQYEQPIDQFINKLKINENLIYQAGNIKIKSLPNNQMQFMIDLYFQNSSKNWINKSHTFPIMEMEHYLIDSEIDKLNQEEEIKFDIEF